MKSQLVTSGLFAGLAAAMINPQQQILDIEISAKARLDTIGQLKAAAELMSSHTDDKTFQADLKTISSEEVDIWTSLLQDFPDTLREDRLLKHPKKSSRRPDSFWDSILHGRDVAAMSTKAVDGSSRPEIDGHLAPYSLRARKVDPGKLGIDSVKQYSGYLDDNENDKHLFYWFFESQNDPKNDPVILWLNGGPGCSSLTGLFMELGSSMIDKSANPVRNPWSWNKNASVIFLDQPVGAGFSYSKNKVSTTVAASKDVYALLSLFFKQFPQYASQDFHIAGESYAGHYIPAFAHEILSHEKRNINLKSIMVGNGLTDPLTQYEYYRPMACGDGGYPAVLGEQECRGMDEALPRCQSLIESCNDSESVWRCVPAGIYCNSALFGPYQRTDANPYDVRALCKGSGGLCYDELDWISKYLNRKDVQEAIGAEVSDYEGCNMDVNRRFSFQGDWMKPFHRLVPGLLEKIPVLIYAGDADFVCNWLGNEAWTNKLEWKHKADFGRAATHDLTLDGHKYGTVKATNNFAFMKLFEAGHMVPYDQPAPSLDMLQRWVRGEWAQM